jgi:hypothetical protein
VLHVSPISHTREDHRCVMSDSHNISLSSDIPLSGGSSSNARDQVSHPYKATRTVCFDVQLPWTANPIKLIVSAVRAPWQSVARHPAVLTVKPMETWPSHGPISVWTTDDSNPSDGQTDTCNSLIWYSYVRFQVLAATVMKMTAFWDTAPCSLVEVHRRFRGAYCPYPRSLSSSSSS